MTLKQEFDFGNAILKEWRRILPEARIVYIVGNHDFRLRKYLIDFAKEIYDFIDFPVLLGLPELNIEFVDLPKNFGRFTDNFIEFNGILIGHFDRASKHSAYTAKSIIDDRGISVVQGHIHRLALYHKTTIRETLTGVENGCLCKREAEYIISPNWQQGFTMIYSIGEKNYFYPIKIDNGAAIWKEEVLGKMLT